MKDFGCWSKRGWYEKDGKKYHRKAEYYCECEGKTNTPTKTPTKHPTVFTDARRRRTSIFHENSPGDPTDNDYRRRSRCNQFGKHIFGGDFIPSMNHYPYNMQQRVKQICNNANANAGAAQSDNDKCWFSMENLGNVGSCKKICETQNMVCYAAYNS